MTSHENHYSQSWELYKAHTEEFADDLEYYLNFCRGKKTLELFAGYGRISNFLLQNNIDLQTVELDKNFASFIKLQNEKNHIIDVLQHTVVNPFEAVIAGYNSFCLLTKPEDIFLFFKKVDSFLMTGGKASLSYYPDDVWDNEQPHEFIFNNTTIHYEPSYTINEKNRTGIWVDTYKYARTVQSYEYPVKLYRDVAELEAYLAPTQLQIHEVIDDYNNPNISEAGWKEFVLVKT